MKKEVKFIGKAKITTQGQVTLPYEGRQDLGIDLESEVYWYEVNNCLIVVKELVNQKELLELISKKRKKK
jgi:bifunctional DNA-binding transcriptional regulator/antitoxin component of YhaV-PrlF toxin-antitoxin module